MTATDPFAGFRDGLGVRVLFEPLAECLLQRGDLGPRPTAWWSAPAVALITSLKATSGPVETTGLTRSASRRPCAPSNSVEPAEPASTSFAADDHDRPSGGEGPTETREPAVASDVEDHVVAVLPGSEVVARVVDDVIGAESSDQIHLRCAADAGDLGSESPGDLHDERAHASRRADDQHLLPRLHVRLADCLERGDPGDGRGGRLLEGEVRLRALHRR